MTSKKLLTPLRKKYSEAEESYTEMSQTGTDAFYSEADIGRSFRQRRKQRPSKRQDKGSLLQNIKEQDPEKRVGIWGLAEEIDNELLFKQISEFLPGVQDKQKFGDVVYAQHKQNGWIFFFSFGVIVFWDFDEQFEKETCKKFSSCLVNQLIDKECDDMLFCNGEMSKISQDKIVLESSDPIEKLAVSYALAQSVKLQIYELEVHKTIEKTKNIPVNLQKTGKINLNKTEIAMMIGELFVQRSYVNLHSDMLDTPDCFWDADEWEHLYMRARKYMEIEKRLENLNNRLEIIKELYEILNSELSTQHADFLELIVIALIVVEVAIEIFWNIIIKDIIKLV